jgi:hypothetical protein
MQAWSSKHFFFPFGKEQTPNLTLSKLYSLKLKFNHSQT